MSELTGWLILAFSLTIIIIVLLIVLALAWLSQSDQDTCNCFGSFGLQTEVDNTALNLCGTDRQSACVFAKNSVADCVTQCNILSNICQAFTFNASTSTMKIVSLTGTYTNVATDLYVRQACRNLT